MKPDRPLILSVLLLAAGLGLIFGYCHGSAGLTAALPISGASFNLCTTTTGPGAVGGFALMVLGLLLLIWSWLSAIVSQIRLLGRGGKREEPAKDEIPGN